MIVDADVDVICNGLNMDTGLYITQDLEVCSGYGVRSYVIDGRSSSD